jgi:hypothetical protein
MRFLLACLALAAACASPQRLSLSIYEHERRAMTFDASGDANAARAEWSAAERQRERLSGQQSMMFARDGQ